jgi:hypothetical protein
VRRRSALPDDGRLLVALEEGGDLGQPGIGVLARAHVDAIFGDRSAAVEGIRALFNSGNRRGARVPRAVAQGRGFSLVDFEVFCPKAVAGIGSLPDTIVDRAIVIPMRRRSPSERVERLRAARARELGDPLRAALADHVPRLERFAVDEATLPGELDDRAQDSWEPLLAIADAAGGTWPVAARAAARSIFGARAGLEEDLGTRLLRDCQLVFEGDVPFLSTAELRTALVSLDQSVWADIRGREITPHYLGKLLRPFDIHSRRHRVSGVGNPIAAYFRADFLDAWTRYLGPPESGTSDTSGTHEAVPEESTHAVGPAVPDVPDVPDAWPTDDGAVPDDELASDADWIDGASSSDETSSYPPTLWADR